MKYETNWERVVLAYMVGSILAGAVFIVGFFITAVIYYVSTAYPPPTWGWQELQSTFWLWSLVSLAWLLGQTVLVSLPWYLLHISGRTHWKYAVGLGVFAVPLTVAFFELNLFWGYAGFAIWGGLMGWLIWRIAYFKNDDTP